MMRDQDLQAPYIGAAPEVEDDDFEDRLHKWLDAAHDTDFAARAIGVSKQKLISFIICDGRSWLEPPMWEGRYLWSDDHIYHVRTAMKLAGER